MKYSEVKLNGIAWIKLLRVLYWLGLILFAITGFVVAVRINADLSFIGLIVGLFIGVLVVGLAMVFLDMAENIAKIERDTKYIKANVTANKTVYEENRKYNSTSDHKKNGNADAIRAVSKITGYSYEEAKDLVERAPRKSIN